MSRENRAKVLDNCAKLFSEALPRLIEAEVTQTGRAIRELNFQLPTLVDLFRRYAAILRSVHSGERAAPPDGAKIQSFTFRRALGVVAVLTPCNDPLMTAVRKLAPALAAGNSVILKPSELTPVSALYLAEIFHTAGVPSGVLSVLPGDGDVTGNALASHVLVRKVDLAGSRDAAQVVGPIASGSLATFTAELGGHAPFIVFDDAPFEAAVNAITFAGFFGAGQNGIGSMRVIAQRNIMGNIMLGVRDKCGEILKRMGAPTNPNSMMGSLASERQLQKVDHLVHEISEETEGLLYLPEAQRLTGISQFDGFDFSKGAFYPPTVISWAEESRIFENPIWHQERFGPVIYIIAFDDEQEAVQWVNEDEFAQGASVWTKDREQALWFSDRVESGTVWVNTHHLIDPSSPWGEMRMASGRGGENYLEAYHSYTTTKTTFMNLATPEESEATDDWFPPVPGGLKWDESV